MGPARKEPDQSTYAGRFAARLRTLRDKAKLSTEQVADALGVHQMTIYKWETGVTSPSVSQYPQIARVYRLKSVRLLFPEN